MKGVVAPLRCRPASTAATSLAVGLAVRRPREGDRVRKRRALEIGGEKRGGPAAAPLGHRRTLLAGRQLPARDRESKRKGGENETEREGGERE